MVSPKCTFPSAELDVALVGLSTEFVQKVLYTYIYKLILLLGFFLGGLLQIE